MRSSSSSCLLHSSILRSSSRRLVNPPPLPPPSPTTTLFLPTSISPAIAGVNVVDESFVGFGEDREASQRFFYGFPQSSGFPAMLRKKKGKNKQNPSWVVKRQSAMYEAAKKTTQKPSQSTAVQRYEPNQKQDSKMGSPEKKQQQL